MRMLPAHEGPGSPHASLGQSAVMVVAMMAPALAGPYLHLWFRSLSRHRWRALTLFSLAYLFVWTAAAVLLSKVATLLLAAHAGPSTLILVTTTLLTWQLSPTRLRCLARCHLRPRISVFGPAALIDPLRFGVTMALWCVASCWALMGLPHLWPQAELPLLALATIIIARERWTEPRQGSQAESISLAARFGDLLWIARNVVPSAVFVRASERASTHDGDYII